jgi:glycosyltransferase involved in cell wall biosynthesis
MEEIPRVQQAADILFLPLAFASPYPGVIRTSAPTKMGEYLAAGRPVLIHAPPDAFICQYFRQHNCGLVVDKNDALALAQAIERILENAELRRDLSAAACERARTDFDIIASRRAFIELLTSC